MGEYHDVCDDKKLSKGCDESDILCETDLRGGAFKSRAQALSEASSHRVLEKRRVSDYTEVSVKRKADSDNDFISSNITAHFRQG